MQTIERNGVKVAGVFNPDPSHPEGGTFRPIASSPITNTARASMSNSERGWYNTATRDALQNVRLGGLGEVVRLSSGEYTIMWTKMATDDPEGKTNAQNMYRAALKREIQKWVEGGQLPPSFMNQFRDDDADVVKTDFSF